MSKFLQKYKIVKVFTKMCEHIIRCHKCYEPCCKSCVIRCTKCNNPYCSECVHIHMNPPSNKFVYYFLWKPICFECEDCDEI